MLGFPGYLDALLYAGVTTVHDLGNMLPYVQQLKQEITAGRLRGPRVFMVGGLVDGPRPVWPPLSFSLTAPEQAPGIVRSMQAGGADNIKAYVGLTEPLVAALVRAAAADSLRVIADLGFAKSSPARRESPACARRDTWPVREITFSSGDGTSPDGVLYVPTGAPKRSSKCECSPMKSRASCPVQALVPRIAGSPSACTYHAAFGPLGSESSRTGIAGFATGDSTFGTKVR